MPSIGSLVVKLIANTSAYKRGMDGANKKTKNFSKSVSKTGARLRRFGGIAAAAAIGGIAVLTKRSLAAIDATAKLSDTLGVSIGELEGLRLAAKINGTDIASLDKGLQFLSKAIGEVSTGISTEATRAFEALGLSVEDMLKLNASDAFIAIADAISSLESPFERAAIAQRIFGRGGKDLLKTLELTGEQLKAFRDEATFFGLNVSRDAASNIEELNDQFTRFGTAISGIGRTLAQASGLNTFVRDLGRGVAVSNIFLKKALGQDISSEREAFGRIHGLTPVAAAGDTQILSSIERNTRRSGAVLE